MLNGMSPSMFVDRKTWFDMNGQFGQWGNQWSYFCSFTILAQDAKIQMSKHARIVEIISKDDHWIHRDEYTGMIQLEYIAIGNQPGEIRRNGTNEKPMWQLKRAEIVLLLYLFGNWQPRGDDFQRVFLFFAIFESY
jgi:hypothetical protein